jgi:hypothetical protein
MMLRGQKMSDFEIEFDYDPKDLDAGIPWSASIGKRAFGVGSDVWGAIAAAIKDVLTLTKPPMFCPSCGDEAKACLHDAEVVFVCEAEVNPWRVSCKLCGWTGIVAPLTRIEASELDRAKE